LSLLFFSRATPATPNALLPAGVESSREWRATNDGVERPKPFTSAGNDEATVARTSRMSESRMREMVKKGKGGEEGEEEEGEKEGELEGSSSSGGGGNGGRAAGMVSSSSSSSSSSLPLLFP